MQFITSLFGGTGNSILTVIFALGVVLVLIVLAVWLLKLLMNASGNVARGRNRRLSVTESLAIDPKRSILVIRRDNVEHLLLVGGPQDLVIETGIAVVGAPALPGRRPVPMVPGRKSTPVPSIKPLVTPAPAEPVVSEPSAIERLRDLGTPAAQRPAKSLRHTGLLRPGNDVGLTGNAGKADKSAEARTDSAKEEGAEHSGEGAHLDGNDEAHRN